MSEKILVIGESRDGVLRNVSFEAIAAAKKIKPDSEIVGVLFGAKDLQEQGEEMIKYGADRVVAVKHDKLDVYTSEGYGQAAMSVIKEENPYGIVMGHTAIGKDLTPKLASKLESGLISDATDVELDGDKAVFTRPIYLEKHLKRK